MTLNACFCMEGGVFFYAFSFFVAICPFLKMPKVVKMYSNRGIMFRLAIKYKEIGTRPEIEIINKKLIEKIESKFENRKIDLQEILEIADKLTKEELKFTTNRVSNNPTELINTNQANCVGYSAMFNSIVIHKLLQENRSR